MMELASGQPAVLHVTICDSQGCPLDLFVTAGAVIDKTARKRFATAFRMSPVQHV
ncbi:hypothetical protein roselon_00593 [Roseibacterium elongatum DSM 19469]|uniref:Uncharacterized protein n=1 Tax=Roseicyclus elongatus DSM 19469 TaxID=1294273 RepID=W8RPS6_9RHOB|nr:hypothetical protein roselon_00593 [Roseibacterium elongatum DSM 19469]